MIQFGPFTISSYITDRFRLDGGAMFGSVPKTLWSKLIPADDKNRIQLACRSLYVTLGDRKILIEGGMGNKWKGKETEIYAIENGPTYPLSKVFPDVTDIILTHLHFDHCGGITTLDESGTSELTFPNANIFVSERNFTHSKNPGIRERASYLPDNILPLEKGKLFLTQDHQEILPGIKVFQVHGHTPGLQCVEISDGSVSLIYLSDLMPTAHHLQVPYVMGYDLCAETAMREKDALLTRALDQRSWLVFVHDNDTVGGQVTKDDRGRYALQPVPGLTQLRTEELQNSANF